MYIDAWSKIEKKYSDVIKDVLIIESKIYSARNADIFSSHKLFLGIEISNYIYLVVKQFYFSRFFSVCFIFALSSFDWNIFHLYIREQVNVFMKVPLLVKHHKTCIRHLNVALPKRPNITCYIFFSVSFASIILFLLFHIPFPFLIFIQLTKYRGIFFSTGSFEYLFFTRVTNKYEANRNKKKEKRRNFILIKIYLLAYSRA